MPFSTGYILHNRYRIVKLIKQGGFGAIYRVWDLNLNRPCAVKENLSLVPGAEQQFQREAILLAGLKHPNLARVYDYFSLPGQGQYLVMDFIEGQDLQQLVDQRGALPESQALGWIGQVCEALEYLHGQNPAIIHRDIKPANIKVNPQGKAVLVDFGIAKMYDPHSKTTKAARAVTAGYSPPEQYGQGTTDARSDIYALGATLYTLLTGQTPIESVQRTVGATLPLPSQLNPAITGGIEALILKAMEIAPDGRFQTTAELRAALASPVKPLEDASTLVLPASGAPTVAEPVIGKAQVSRPVKWRWIGLPIGLGIIAIVLFFLWGDGLFAGTGDARATQAARAGLQLTQTAQEALLERPTSSPTATKAAPVEPHAAETVSPTIRDTPTEEPIPTDKPTLAPTPWLTSARVLWEDSHKPRVGETGAYTIGGVFSELDAWLSENNIFVESGNLNSVDLNAYNSVVVAAGSAYKMDFTQAEAELLSRYVQNGGGLLILGENEGFSNGADAVAGYFGVRLARSSIYGSITDHAPHAIFAGVGSLHIEGGGSLESTNPAAQVVAWIDRQPVVIIMEYPGSGRVAVVGDNGIFDNRWLDELDNSQFAVNVFRWITHLID